MAIIRICDLGECAHWQEGPYHTWVSKTDFVQYRRCPFRVYMSHTHGLPYAQFIARGVRDLLARGSLFEAKAFLGREAFVG